MFGDIHIHQTYPRDVWNTFTSGGSRISRRILYIETKESGPLGGRLGGVRQCLQLPIILQYCWWQGYVWPVTATLRFLKILDKGGHFSILKVINGSHVHFMLPHDKKQGPQNRTLDSSLT